MEDYSKLRIDPGAKPGAHALRKPVRAMYLAAGAIIIAILATWMGKAWLDGAVNVKVATVSSTFPAQAHTLFNATGYVVPQRKADVASNATGRLESLHVEEGSRVKAGQVLARLENRDLLASRNRAAANVDVARAHVNEAAAALDESRLMFERTAKLVRKHFATQEDYDAAQARLKKAQAALASAQAAVVAAESALQETEVAVEYTSIRAPFDGVILRKYADMGSLQVEADVAESNFPSVRAGQPCEVQVDRGMPCVAPKQGGLQRFGTPCTTRGPGDSPPPVPRGSGRGCRSWLSRHPHARVAPARCGYHNRIAEDESRSYGAAYGSSRVC
ncbi:hypothetical protein BH18PSE1_BH18PSE1_10250 [soil metagenome]